MLNSLHIFLIDRWILLGKFLVKAQRFQKRLLGVSEALRGAVEEAQVVERHRYIRLIGIGVFLRQFAVQIARFQIRLLGVSEALRGAVEVAQVVERRRYIRLIGIGGFLRQFPQHFEIVLIYTGRLAELVLFLQ